MRTNRDTQLVKKWAAGLTNVVHERNLPETSRPNSKLSPACTKRLPAPGKAERIDILIGLYLLGTRGQAALIRYIQTKQAQRSQKGTIHV